MNNVPDKPSVDAMIASCEAALSLVEEEASRLRMRLSHLQQIKLLERKTESV